jgi:hypothetical protein
MTIGLSTNTLWSSCSWRLPVSLILISRLAYVCDSPCRSRKVLQQRFGFQSVEALRYYELACAALADTRVNTDPTLEAVQALVRVVCFTWMARKSQKRDSVSYWHVHGPA